MRQDADPGDVLGDADAVLAAVFREEHSRLLATLVRRFGDLDLAEDAAQEAMAAALEVWPSTGVPDSPLAWLTTVARRRALDRVRRDDGLARRLALLRILEDGATAPPADAEALAERALPDDRLAMLLGCCHPALAPADRIALMLRFVSGLSTADIAQALLLPVPTVQARITRAKKRVARAGAAFRVPQSDAEVDERLPLVLTAVSLVFTEGYAATSGAGVVRVDLCDEAVRLARILVQVRPGSAEPIGLLALLLLSRARSQARVDRDGLPVPLREQDRERWDRRLVEEGILRAERAATLPDAGRFTIQACIAAVHCEAPDYERTDWAQIVALYTLLAAVDPSPVVKLNRAIALGRRDGPAAGLRALELLGDEPELRRHHPYPVARALTLAELGRDDEAVAALQQAIDLCGNDSERRYLQRELTRLAR